MGNQERMVTCLLTKEEVEKQIKDSMKYRLDYLTELENQLKEEKEKAYFDKIEKLRKERKD